MLENNKQLTHHKKRKYEKICKIKGNEDTGDGRRKNVVHSIIYVLTTSLRSHMFNVIFTYDVIE